MLLKSLIVSTVILAGCCSPVPKPPQFDSYLISECTTYTLNKNFTSWEEVIEEKIRNKRLEEECRNKHSGLINSYNNYLKEFNATK